MPHADTLFLGGVVYVGPGRGLINGASVAGDPDTTATDARPQLLQVAIVDGVVAAIDADLADWVGPDTEVVDLAGGMLHAGFVDAHIHPIQGGLERLACDLSEGSTRDEYLAIITEYAAAHPVEGERLGSAWITGGGWAMSAFPGGTPTAAELDAVVSDRPVFLYNRDHHGAWANSAALALGGVTAETADPADGRIERLADGKPSGTLHEGAAALIAAVAPDPTPDEEYAALLEAQRYALSLGVTGWQDAIIGNYFGSSDTTRLYRAALRSGQLLVDVTGALWWDRNRGIEQVPALVARRDAVSRDVGPGARFRVPAVKIMADGVVENGTAAMLESYLGDAASAEHPRGIAFVGGQALVDAIVALDAAGFGVHVHVIGDAACRDALDGFAAARERNGWATPGRHHLAHLQFVHPDDVTRFAALGVTANMQALWACNEPQMRQLTVPIVGPERAQQQYPFASIARASSVGAPVTSAPRLCAGSDWPVSTPDPWQAIHVAVNRTLPETDADYDPEPLLAHEALTLAEALDAYTAGSAWITGRGPTDPVLDARGAVAHGAGVIEVGAVADLAATDRDPFAGPAARIHETSNVGTWVAGRRVYG